MANYGSRRSRAEIVDDTLRQVRKDLAPLRALTRRTAGALRIEIASIIKRNPSADKAAREIVEWLDG